MNLYGFIHIIVSYVYWGNEHLGLLTCMYKVKETRVYNKDF